VNPLDNLFKWFPQVDFAVLEHRFAKHGRDYILFVEDCLGSDPGQHEIVFTHCVKAECETRVTDEVWLKSWGEEFTDYQRWTRAGEPDGHVWGTNCSLAYPGLRAVLDSGEAASWTRRIGKDNRNSIESALKQHPRIFETEKRKREKFIFLKKR
jgi:hypothetical protein